MQKIEKKMRHHSENKKGKVKFTEIVHKMMRKIKDNNDRHDEVSATLGSSKLRTFKKLFRENFSSFIHKNAYIVTNVFMMIWSIVYHSWLGFILLIWANAIWIRTDQRGKMMNSSPFLVIYATCLLLINYVYGMNFTDDELPVKWKGVDQIQMHQIGLIKHKHYPGVYLLMKSFLTISFWITMRFMIQENNIVKRKITLKFEDTIDGARKENNFKKELETISKIIETIERACVFCWMWIIIIVLFVMGISGDHMELFRIINTVFALIFTLMFQVSFKLWRKAMYIFWSCLIIYAMASLVLIYGYQFDDFPEFSWLPHIGLHKYETGKLFTKLLSFTLVIILTGLQINYFHDRFLKYFDATTKKELNANEESLTDELKLVSFKKNHSKQFLNFIFF